MLRKHKRRRGVVILVVLSLLVLFTLLMATYVIVSGQFHRASQAFAREELYGVQPQKDLDRAMYQLLRDTNQRTSAVRFHSLLRDYYGEGGFRGRLRSASDLQEWNTDSDLESVGGYAFIRSGQQFRDLPVDNATLRDFFGASFTMQTSTHPPGFCAGRVLTITSGPARGWSTTIVGFLYSPGGVPVIRVLDFRPDQGVAPGWSDLGNAEFIVNGRPFSGAGAGFRIGDVDPDPNNAVYVAKLDAPVFLPSTPDPIPVPAALLPHHIVRDEFGQVLDPLSSPYPLFQGGSNEPYDAVDYQNMFLGLVLPNATSSLDIIPSLHRPALINHWAYELDGGGDLEIRDLIRDPDFRRMVIMRPIAPNFDGSNPEYALAWNEYQADPTDDNLNALLWRYINGPWDVDNDGDGIRDSIWVDLGMPIQTSPDGRKYKPLFAILCVDLDGRLNVNAHGNPTHFYANRPPDTSLAAGTTAGYPTPLARGMGYGTPEIALGMANITGDLQQLLMGRHPDGVPGSASPAFDLLARVKFFEEPPNYFSGAGGLSSYFTPPDLRGELAYGMDVFGRPVWEPIPPAVVESRANSPYEINLLEQNAHDRPFTAAELEAVLRRYDIDAAQLPRRLRDLLNLTDLENTRLVTTHSFDPPVPGTAVISDLADHQLSMGGNTNIRSVPELIGARLRQNGVSQAQVPAMLRHLVPSEVLMGQRMDINRPLGDGRDTSGNSLVDEINVNEQFPVNPDTGDRWNERMSGWHQGVGPSRTEFRNVPIHHTGGVDVNQDGSLNAVDLMLARQLLARHIYVLLMALRDENHLLLDDDGDPSEEATAYALAQFAINVVDFRDADSIMTPFEFDIRPFQQAVAGQLTTWNVDGDLTSNEGAHRGVVWGTERPELVITETLAWHDRRTEDLENDDGIGTLTTDEDEPDPHFDQRLMPRGSFFVELFNPWTTVTESAIPNPRAADLKPAELYAAGGVQLNRVATANGVTSPVWRMMFVKDENPGLPKDPDHHHPDRRPNPTTDEIRLIYFVNPTVFDPTTPVITGVAGVYTTTLPVGNIAPGQYAVIGSPGIEETIAGGADRYISPVGRSVNAWDGDSNAWTESTLDELDMENTRRVVLSPEGPAPQVRVLGNGIDLPAVGPADPNNDANPGTYVNYPNADGSSPDAPYVVAQPHPDHLMPPRAIVVNYPALSVSEPPEGYDTLGFVTPADSDTVEGFFSTPRDEPFDLDRYGSQLMTDGTHVWGTIHLQRLANPNVPYDSVVNPYRTIDSLRVDLTSFNGVNALGAETLNEQALPRQPIRLFSVQRGDRHSLPGTPDVMRRQFWPQEPTVALPQDVDWGMVDPNSADASHYFNFYMRTTLGSLNHGFWPYNDATLGDMYRGSPSVDVTDGAIVNNQAFSSLAWNNRPFVSGYELMQVPLRRSSQLLRNYWLPLELPPGDSPYDVADPFAEYGHLVNFFHSSPANVQNASVHAHRLLEYVHVPSRFVGTDTLLNPGLNPGIFRNVNPVTNPLMLDPPNLNPSFLTPFNRVSRYRDPGRVNINTIYHEKVWEALFGGYAHIPYQDLVASRRGSAGTRPELLPRNPSTELPDPRFPTFFANPFRPPGHGSLVPLPDLERPDVETTLLRSRATVPDYGGSAQTPPGDAPLLEGGHVSVNDATIASTHPRNSMFRYNALRRMGNMVTTRSNVYAIWITVGYFEVEPNMVPGEPAPVVDVFHPDGYRVAQEVGIDTGQVRRHRAFYIVDRTIPVAFQPGQNHNVDRAVLLRRFIE